MEWVSATNQNEMQRYPGNIGQAHIVAHDPFTAIQCCFQLGENLIQSRLSTFESFIVKLTSTCVLRMEFL